MSQLGEVREEETDKIYQVKGRCKVCASSWRQGEFKFGWIFNKHTRMMHLPSTETNETTHCGHPATGKAWLHQL